MIVKDEIARSRIICQELWKTVQRLERLGTDPHDPVFDVIADRMRQEHRKWELLANCEPENTYFIGHAFNIELYD